MNKLSLCIFDMDGLLIDSERGMWMVSERKAFKFLGQETSDKFLQSIMGVSGSDLRKIFDNAYGKDFPFKIWQSKVAEFNDDTIENGEIALMPGAKELLEYLKAKQIKCVVGTGTMRPKALKVLSKTGLIDYFDEVYSGYDVKHGKPAPDIYLKCLNGVKPSEALVFEDSLNGGKASIAAGIKLILVPDLCPISDDVLNKAYKVLDSLDKAIPVIEKIIG